MTDANELVHLRARYYDPNVGVFASLDPFEGINSRPMSMNGYSWVEGNVANWTDASGMTCDIPYQAISLVPSLNQNSQPCPTPGTHNLVQTRYDLEWLNGLKFCKNGYKNDNHTEIMNQITNTYGFDFPPRFLSVNNIRLPINQNSPLWGWSWDDLAGIGRGAWLIVRAIQNVNPSPISIPSERLFRDAFAGTKVEIGAGSSPIAALAINVGNAGGVVPPVGLGGSGDTVYMREGLRRPDHVFIHELGHILDFRLGTIWSFNDQYNRNSPSTMLINETGGYYSMPYPGVFEIEIVLNSEPYIAGEFPTIYGQQNHYEDFAESFFVWIMKNTIGFHLDSVEYMGDKRHNFFNRNIFIFLSRASR